jgi:hypothetical protein
LKYLNQKGFLFYIEKKKISYEHRVYIYIYILISFKSHIEKIKHSFSVYIVNFDMS